MDHILNNVIPKFHYLGVPVSYQAYGNGNINLTYIVNVQNAPVKRYILQKINGEVFADITSLMKNVENVTTFLSGKIAASGGNKDRECLSLIPTSDGKMYYVDEYGAFWRSYNFIDRAFCFDKAEKPDHVRESGKAFGRFLRLLDEYPAENLFETIPDFHNVQKRFAAFTAAVDADHKNRAVTASKEISHALRFKDDLNYFTDLRAKSLLPVRVTHNDTKFNNVMIDMDTERAVCVLDLDTVMPGLSAYDYGDSIRSCASSAEEDEADLSKVYLDDRLFDAFTRGYLSECALILSKKEIEVLPTAVILITYELALRFLTDYLNGDEYFRIRKPTHNLDRAANQLKLLSDMEYKTLWMSSAIRRIINQL
ncbi:MAG: aminoglycoside phosphotransferase family protein [Clostridiales bacterium]|nr:aminoglycoside phosphotransferase family protein [Clostridiales bacterium]